MPALNPHISVDCVILGFDSKELKVLLIEREHINGVSPEGHKLKLPGSLIYKNEDLDKSAYRTLFELTGLRDIFLKQFAVFGNPNRLSPQEDLDWLRKTTNNYQIDRVVTIAYYSLIKLTESNRTPKTIWYPVKNLPDLIFDHNQIIKKALEILRNEIRSKPLCFELLPKKFTIRQMHDVYEAILDESFDSRNFRKKLKPLKFLVPLQEKEKGVNHKPAQLYRFDRKLYFKYNKKRNGFIL
ncbi:MAG: NUDIX hydrolase [Bacteroidales bacterium]|nr:NUDIX hydrolase [Bacteroidales bacterium]